MSNRVEGGLGTETEQTTGSERGQCDKWAVVGMRFTSTGAGDLPVMTFVKFRYGGGEGAVDGMAGHV